MGKNLKTCMTSVLLYKRYYEPTYGSNDKLEKNIFEFSNMIGAFVTYSIIQSINGDNYRNKKEVSQQALIESIRQYMIKCVGNIVPYLVTEVFRIYPKLIS